MEISNDRKLKDLQEEFTKTFPFLKIEFYSIPYVTGKSSNEAFQLDSEQLIGTVRTQLNFGFIPLSEDMKVGDFEQLLWQLYDLHVQVFRKSYGKWLQTWATDNWTLKDQNHRSSILGEKGIIKKDLVK